MGDDGMQSNGSGSFWFIALLGCCFFLIGLVRNAEAAVEHGGHRRVSHSVHPARKLVFRQAYSPRESRPGEDAHHLVRYISGPVPTTYGREDHVVLRGGRWDGSRHGLFHYAGHSTYLWCVPYARRISHIDLVGDAFLWWAEASGRYARGSQPESGAILAFRAISQMPLGHVAVVSRVINNREVLVDQANWVHNRITRNIRIVDVSPTNSWTDVRVEKRDGKLGDPYPTYGFIYDHSPSDMVIARQDAGIEVAEAPRVNPISLSAPHRNLQ